MRASPVAGVYDETVDREVGFGNLAKADRRGGRDQGGQLRTEARDQTRWRCARHSFGETVVKQVVKSGVPMLTRVLESFLKNRK